MSLLSVLYWIAAILLIIALFVAALPVLVWKVLAASVLVIIGLRSFRIALQ